jgi:hypothetical protein
MTQYWFRPKKRGYGAGLPIHWKGWVALGLYAGAIVAMPWVYVTYLGIPDEFLYRLIGVVVLSVPFVYIAWKKTEGGWRWRTGKENENEDG